MRWNWQQDDWPSLVFDAQALTPLEDRFLREGGVLIGAAEHLGPEDRDRLTVQTLGAEAVKSSEIEGEILDRQSVQSSIRRELGLAVDRRAAGPAEQGIATVMVDLYRDSRGPLSDALLFRWHERLMQGAQGIDEIGRYRSHPEAMRVVSGPAYAPKVHFVGPPSEAVPAEMTRFIDWFNRTGPGGPARLRPLSRAGIAHLYFESIHPFEDGNGRIGRVISEKALAQGLGQPSLIALSVTIESQRKGYYDALEEANKRNEVTAWLLWFGEAVLAAQARSQDWVRFLIDKAKFFDRFGDALNARQQKALLRMTEEGPEGFRGGLSAGNYSRITGAPAATARRDLGKLVQMGALLRTGERKGTRYWLPFEKAR